MTDQLVDHVLRGVVGQALQELGEVLLAVEVVASFGGVVDIPGDFFELLECREEIRWLTKRGDDRAYAPLFPGFLGFSWKI